MASLLLIILPVAMGFVVHPSPQRQLQIAVPSTETALFAVPKGRRGKLGSLIEMDGVPASSIGKKKRKSKKKVKKGESASSVSPDLAAWASGVADTSDDDEEASDETLDSVITSVTDEASTFSSFKQKGSARRQKQNSREATEETRTSNVQAKLKQLTTAIDDKKSVGDILKVVESLTTLSSGNLRKLTAGAKRSDFRLLWVGSDDAISHVGTGLHKIPLARLQEIFLTCKTSRMELIEVIRVLGPFPNVKNTLQGMAKVQGKTSDGSAQVMTITWDSLIDGTGKEILAGTQQNTRNVPLHVYWSDTNAIVAVVPPDVESGAPQRENPWEQDGKNVLVFIKEEFLDDQLEILRVA